MAARHRRHGFAIIEMLLEQAEMSIALSFIIPVRHPSNSRDWPTLKRNLSQTIASIAAQQSDAWSAVIVANQGSDLPPLPARFSVKWVEFPPNRRVESGAIRDESWWDALRLDKGRRILAGMIHAGTTSYMMAVDEDDFVHRGLTTFVTKNSGKNGWRFSKGYLWADGGGLLYLTCDFSGICGSSHIVRSDLYGIPAALEDASEEYLRYMLGAHRFIDRILSERGTPLDPLPFPGAIWRVGHSGSASGSTNVIPRLVDLRAPVRSIKEVFRIRLKTKSVERDFFGSLQDQEIVSRH